MNDTFNSTEKITTSGLTMALYVAVMYMTQGFAFGQSQIRIATSLYGLAAVFPFLALPLGIANFLSNVLMGGLGPLDMIGGAVVGILTCWAVILGQKTRFPNICTALAITLIPGFGVATWLAWLLHVPYWTMACSLIIGQAFPGLVGSLLVSTLEKRLFRRETVR